MPILKFYETKIAVAGDGRVYVPLPFDPGAVWGGTPRHVGGSLNTQRFRGIVDDFDGVRGVGISAMWARDCGIGAGQAVDVILTAEGPLRGDMAPDLAQALSDDPTVAAFWDALAQFYRKAYVKWVDGTKGRPDVRAARIAELVGLLKAGKKARPKD